MFPCFDQPDLKARLTVTILTYDDWVVATNAAEKHHYTIKLNAAEIDQMDEET